MINKNNYTEISDTECIDTRFIEAEFKIWRVFEDRAYGEKS